MSCPDIAPSAQLSIELRRNLRRQSDFDKDAVMSAADEGRHFFVVARRSVRGTDRQLAAPQQAAAACWEADLPNLVRGDLCLIDAAEKVGTKCDAINPGLALARTTPY
jgi:hypothetical protein